MRIVSRAEWGAVAARSTTPLRPERVNLFVLHHTTGSYRGQRSVQQIQAFHQGPERKWADVGYNFLVAPDGTVYEGRGWGFAGAHARGKNSESIGVAFIGDGSKEMPAAAKSAVLELLRQAEERFGPLRTVGHRDVGTTACPGDAIYAWWSSDARSAVKLPPKVTTPGKAEVSAERTTARRSPVPDLRAGWRGFIERSGWRRSR